MRKPSARILANRVDIYRFTPTYDADGGLDGTVNLYPTLTYPSVACSAQPDDPKQEIDESNRVTTWRPWTFIFGAALTLGLKDKVVYVDTNAVSHTIILDGGQLDMASRGGAYSVTGVERL